MAEPAHVVQQSIEERISAANAPPEEQVTESNEGVAEAALSSSEPQETEQSEQSEQPEAQAAEQEAQSAESEVTEEDAAQEVPPRLSEFAEAIDADAADLYNLIIPATDADGQQVEVTLSELKDRYQDNSKAAKLQKQAQEEYEALNQQRVALEQQIESQAVQTKTYLDAAHAELTQEFNSINWDQLRQADPGQYAVKRQDFIERQGRLQNIAQKAAQERDNQQQQLKAQRDEQFGQYALREQQALFDAIPEWRNQEAAQAEQVRVSEYLLNTGFSQDEIQNAYDHRAIVLARKAMLWDEQQKKASVAKKKVLKIGKTVLKPGARQSKADQTAEREKALRAQMRNSGGSVNVAADLIQNRLGR